MRTNGMDAVTREHESQLRHDIRNRINQIVGYSEILIEDASASDANSIVPDLARINEAGRSLLELVESAFAVAGQEPEGGDSKDGAAPAPVRRDFISGTHSAEYAAEPTESGECGKLLIVDDSAENRALLTRRLSRLGHSCVEAASGREGLEQLRNTRFDVILLDLMMPEMDGFDVLAAIKRDSASKNIPVVMISASDEIDSVARCIEMGATDYLTKPFNPIILRARVEASLREKRLRDREERLFRELEENYRRERRITDALQRSLIEEIPEDSFDGLKIAALYEAAWSEAQVGGDLFDAFRLPNGKVALVVADASGKGLAAAARIAQAKYVLRAFAREYEGEPHQIVGHLNDYLCDANPLDENSALSFIALSLAIIDPTTGEGKFVCAGSEAPLILRAKTQTAEALGTHGLPLGIESKFSYTTIEGRLETGDLIVMCTDGITEARVGYDLMGYEKMTELAIAGWKASDGDVREIGRTIMEGARAFGRGTLKDDACLLLARLY